MCRRQTTGVGVKSRYLVIGRVGFQFIYDVIFFPPYCSAVKLKDIIFWGVGGFGERLFFVPSIFMLYGQIYYFIKEAYLKADARLNYSCKYC